MRLACVVWLVLAAPLWADPTVSLPADLKARPGRLLRVEVKADGVKSLVWIGPEGDADVIQSDSGKWAIFSAPAAGKYRIVVVGVAGDGATATATGWVQVEGPTPPPVPPDPPTPTDPLAQSLQAAYKLDTDADKAKSAAFLAAIYRGAPALVDLPDVKTNSDLVAKISQAVRTPGLGLADAAVPNLRKAIGAYLNAQLGTVASAPVDKDRAKAAFAALAKALDTLR